MRKTKEADLKQQYQLNLMGGWVMSLSIMIILFRINLYSAPPTPPPIEEQEIIQMEEIIQTKQIETPPPPPRPPVPVEVPNDEILEDDIVELDLEFDLGDEIALPPPPPPKEEEEQFFIVVENMPQLIGGLGKLQSQVTYPEMARRAGIEGRVTIQFIVNERGQVENPRVIRGIGGGCDEEALAAVSKARFTPGLQRGRPVKVQYSLPIVFRLQNNP
jgi:protein TonB